MQDFDKIYKENYSKLYTLAFRMTGTKEDSEDVLQSSFLNAYKAYPKFKGKSTLYTWLYKIVLNESKKHYKKTRKLPTTEYAEMNNISIEDVYGHINSFGNTEDNALTELTREACLQMFMNCMPSKYRAVYTLRVILDFSVKETSLILEISLNAVKVNLHRAREIIKSHFDGRCSLINPNSLCDCRKYAKFLIENNKTGKLIDINVIRQKERKASEDFHTELKDILQIESLYYTEIKPIDYNLFIKRVSYLVKANKHTLLKSC